MPSQEVSDALTSGKGFVDLSSWTKVDVAGTAALMWLSHIGSTDVEDLAPGRAKPTVLRSQEGIRCEITVALAGASVLVIQDPDQPQSIVEVLGELTGSYQIAIEDRSDALTLFSFPGATRAPDVAGTAFSAPSCLGAGIDIFALSEDHAYLLGSLQHGFMLVDLEDAREWLGGPTSSE
jgi:glycine cleavage system aminomethyltransferase T